MAVGKAAVEYALKGMNAMMPVIVRTSDAPYRWKIAPAPLDKIANHEKKMPADFLRKDGYGITAAARRYLEPLIRGEAPPPYGRDGLPKYVALKNVAVKKKLPAFEGWVTARRESHAPPPRATSPARFVAADPRGAIAAHVEDAMTFLHAIGHGRSSCGRRVALHVDATRMRRCLSSGTEDDLRAHASSIDASIQRSKASANKPRGSCQQRRLRQRHRRGAQAQRRLVPLPHLRPAPGSTAPLLRLMAQQSNCFRRRTRSRDVQHDAGACAGR